MLQCLGVGAEQSVSLNSLLVITISLHCCIGHSIFFQILQFLKKISYLKYLKKFSNANSHSLSERRSGDRGERDI